MTFSGPLSNISYIDRSTRIFRFGRRIQMSLCFACCGEPTRSHWYRASVGKLNFRVIKLNIYIAGQEGFVRPDIWFVKSKTTYALKTISKDKKGQEAFRYIFSRISGQLYFDCTYLVKNAAAAILFPILKSNSTFLSSKRSTFFKSSTCSNEW